jgi:L-arabinose isomerase
MTEDIQPRSKVGVFGIGLEDYWDQFEGLRDRLEGYQQSVEERIGWWATVV